MYLPAAFTNQRKVWLTIFGILFLLSLNGCYNKATEYKELIGNHQKANGTVRSKNCRNHGEYWYQFELNGKVRKARAQMAAKFCDEVNVGDQIVVYYNPSNPDIHTLLIPEAAYASEHGFYFPIWLVFLLALPVYILVEYLKARSADQRSSRSKIEERGNHE